MLLDLRKDEKDVKINTPLAAYQCKVFTKKRFKRLYNIQCNEN